MGLFSKILGPHPEPAAILSEAIERLQAGILTNLTLLYGSRLPPTEALLLANCVLNYAMRMEPLGAEAQSYQESHGDLGREEAMRLSSEPEVAEALSYLYAAITLHLAIRTGQPLSQQAFEVGQRATELSLYIPNTYDICGSGDALKCIQAIRTFAQDYLRRALGR